LIEENAVLLAGTESGFELIFLSQEEIETKRIPIVQIPDRILKQFGFMRDDSGNIRRMHGYESAVMPQWWGVPSAEAASTTPGSGGKNIASTDDTSTSTNYGAWDSFSGSETFDPLNISFWQVDSEFSSGKGKEQGMSSKETSPPTQKQKQERLAFKRVSRTGMVCFVKPSESPLELRVTDKDACDITYLPIKKRITLENKKGRRLDIFRRGDNRIQVGIKGNIYRVVGGGFIDEARFFIGKLNKTLPPDLRDLIDHDDKVKDFYGIDENIASTDYAPTFTGMRRDTNITYDGAGDIEIVGLGKMYTPEPLSFSEVWQELPKAEELVFGSGASEPETPTFNLIPIPIQPEEDKGLDYRRPRKDELPPAAVVEPNNNAGDRVSKVADGLGALSAEAVSDIQQGASGISLSGCV
jgi:hypothetical protein